MLVNIASDGSCSCCGDSSSSGGSSSSITLTIGSMDLQCPHHGAKK